MARVIRQSVVTPSSFPRELQERHMMRVYVGAVTVHKDYVNVSVTKSCTAAQVVNLVLIKVGIGASDQYDLVEGMCVGGEVCKERRLAGEENPVCIQLLWPRPLSGDTEYRFFLHHREAHKLTSMVDSPGNIDKFLDTFLRQPPNKEYPDLCNLPNLNENTLLQNLRSRFEKGSIYTYVGSILIAVNPFRFYPIYNPKYVKMYQNRRLGDLPPHIFAVADAAFHTMLTRKSNQCIVISGESGSGKTESTNLLLHHLSALSHRGLPDSGIEQTILCAGPVLEAFGNAKTVYNNNSSRFGKFIQVNYKENGMVYGAVVEKYLLEKSRIVSQAQNERNYHVFYYLLAGLTEKEKLDLWLTEPEEYHYLNQSKCYTLEDVDGQCIDEAHEFIRLKQSMEMVGFSADIQRRLFLVLAAILHIGNVEFKKKSDQIHHESVTIKNMAIIKIISVLLKVKETTLVDALTKKKTVAGGEKVVMQYKMQDAMATRDAMAKCLYGAIFDWIVLQINHALLAKRENKPPQSLYYIGVLDIFGFEDFTKNSFEQFCINFANEHLHYYFNQHIFKFEQEEYQREGIQWKNIEFIDNTGCLDLFAHKPTGLLCLLDEECSFPAATNESLLAKFHAQHKSDPYYEVPQVRENAFAILHYAGKVKYRIQDFREKNSDLMRQDIEFVLKNSSLALVRELVGNDPVAMMRWSMLRVFFKSYFAFIEAGRRGRRPSGSRWGSLKRQTSARSSRSLGANRDSFSDLSPDLLSDNKLDLAGSPEKIPPSRSEPCTPTSSNEICFPTVFRSSPGEVLPPAEKDSQDSFIYSPQDKVVYRANKLILKSKSSKRSKSNKWSRNMKAMKTIAGRSVIGTRKNKQPSVSAQFNLSLTKLMETLSQGNPFFVRCIKSNSEKAACKFDETQVLRQLRYTGMLATVLIRQSGFNYRLTFEEFIQHYKILLPNGLLSSKGDVQDFLQNSNLNPDNFQLGKNKVFLREREKLALDEALHNAIMKRILCIQRWVRARLDRFHFLQMRSAAVILQSHVRSFKARRKLCYLQTRLHAVLCIQKHFHGYRVRRHISHLHKMATDIQRVYRGYKTRFWFQELLEHRRQEAERRRKVEEELERLRKQRLEQESQARKDRLEEQMKRESELVNVHIHISHDEAGKSRDSANEFHSTASDEGVLTKESSIEEIDRDFESVQRHDSEESSGILEDDTEMMSSTPATTPTVELRKRDSGRPGDREEDAIKAYINPAFEQDTPATSNKRVTRRMMVKSCSIEYVPSEPTRDKEKRISAPLAKQESFHDSAFQLDVASSDLDTDHSADRQHLLLDVGTSEEQTSNYKSPLQRAHKKIRDFMGGGKKPGKKELTTDESDDEAEETPTTPKFGDMVFPVPISEDDSKSDVNQPKSPELMVDMSLLPDFNKRKKKPHHKPSRIKRPVKADTEAKAGRSSNWKVSGSNLWEYPEEYAIRDATELKQLDQFIFSKIVELSKDCGRRDTVFDKVFKGAMRDFHTSLLSLASLGQSFEVMRYKDLMANFEGTLMARMKEENTNATFPITMGINAFRGFLDEFHKKKTSKDTKENEIGSQRKENSQRKEGSHRKEKKRKDNIMEFHGHMFVTTSFSIPTYCEFCNSLIWVEKGHVCKNCKYTCHKKCYTRSKVICKGFHSQPQGGDKQVIGVPLSQLLTGKQIIPPILERLITAIELHGLYSEGLYRKAGAASKIRQLIRSLNTDGEKVRLDDYRIHVLTSALKTFFREMPEPLLTYEHYEEFLRVTDIQDTRERVQTLYAIINQLPTVHHDVLERLMFHLARVAQFESANKMSSNSLAIVFAPCILRSNKAVTAQESLSHVPRQTQCIQLIIEEQLKKLITTLADIDTLETAEATVSDRLTAMRASLREKTGEGASFEEDNHLLEVKSKEEQALAEQIRTIQQEKDELTLNLPTLEEFRMGSSDEDILSQDDIDIVTDSPDDFEPLYDEYAVTFDLPVSPPRDLRHLNKRRAKTPNRSHPKKSKLKKSADDKSANSSAELLSDQLDSDGYLVREFVTVSELQTVGDEILV